MPIYEGVTVAEAEAKGLKELGLNKDQVSIEILVEGKKGFLGLGKKNARVSMEILSHSIVESDKTMESETKQESVSEEFNDFHDTAFDLATEEALEKLALYLKNITKQLKAPANIEIQTNGQTVTVQLDTEKQGILIGKHGKMLNALQYLSQVYVNRISKNKMSIILNVGNYREKRQAVLERLAYNSATKTMETGQPVFLEPMPAFERKIIHSILSKKDHIKTYSEGDEPYRYLVIESIRNNKN